MTLEDQAAYIQQLKQETNLDRNDPKERLLFELGDTVSLLCHQIYSMGAVVDGLNETLDVVQDQLDQLVDMEEEYEVGPDGERLGLDEYYDGKEQPLYEVKCPQCGDRFAVDEDTLMKGFSCPSCGERLIKAE